MQDRLIQWAIVFVALGCLSLWWLFDAQTMMRLGLLHRSLTHDDIRVVTTVKAELALARYGALVLGVLLLAVALFRDRLLRIPFVRDLSTRPSDKSAEYRDYLARFATPSLAVMASAYAAITAYVLLAETLLSPSAIGFVNREDGLIETVSALLLLAAAALSLRIALSAGRDRGAFWMHLLLAVLFFAMFGEEISWGQRLIGFETPKAVSSVNVQNELNIHNLFGYFFDHLFMLCFLLWGVAVPLAYRFSAFCRGLFETIGLPVPSAGLAVSMLMVSLMQYRWYHAVIPPLESLRLAEARELLSALAFLVLMAEVWRLDVPGRGR